VNGFRIGSILGIEIRIDYSWFVIFFLILWTFSSGVFPAVYPGQPTPTYLAMGVAGTFLFFSSLLAHELAHSVVAMRKGIPVDRITLFIFGGMAHTRMEFESPGDEFLIAGAGPVSSFLIALLFAAVGWTGATAGWSPAVVWVAQYLAFLNVILAVFNLLPGFPLDGGRLFRAAVWKASGSLEKATRWASMGGKVLGYLLMALGLLSLFGGNVIGGVWMIFIGWFVRMAAEAGYTQYLLHAALEGIRARDLMAADPETVPAEATLREFVEDYVFSGRHNAYPVVEGAHPLGILTLDRVKSVPREEWETRTVRGAMVPLSENVVVHPEEGMTRVMEKLQESQVRRVLVARNGELLGIITRGDLARWLERHRMLAGR
jgi:Zn-dependent protease/CBS domain-containing protein